MADRDLRDAGLDMLKAPGQPFANHRLLLGGDLLCGGGPALDKLPLQLALFWRQAPIARFATYVIAGGGEPSFGAIHGVRSGRSTEPLVVGALVSVHQLADHVIFGFGRDALRAAVVRQRKKRRGPALPASIPASARNQRSETRSSSEVSPDADR